MVKWHNSDIIKHVNALALGNHLEKNKGNVPPLLFAPEMFNLGPNYIFTVNEAVPNQNDQKLKLVCWNNFHSLQDEMQFHWSVARRSAVLQTLFRDLLFLQISAYQSFQILLLQNECWRNKIWIFFLLCEFNNTCTINPSNLYWYPKDYHPYFSQISQ